MHTLNPLQRRIATWRTIGWIAMLSLIACSSDTGTDGPETPISVIIVTLGSSQLKVGDRTQATAVAHDANGAVVGGQTMSWTSSDPSVAAVSSTGMVTGMKPGSASIMAGGGHAVGSATVSVAAAPPPPATQLAITRQPSSSAQSGVPLAQQPIVQLQDASGNSVSQAGVSIRVAVASGGGALSGTTTINTTDNGTATFSNLAIAGTGAQTLSFTSNGLTSVVSSSITLTQPPPTQATRLALVTQPSATALSGATLAVQPVVQLQDDNGV